MVTPPISKIFVLSCTLLLSACGGSQESAGTRELENLSRTLVPADAELAGIYNRSCRSCHTIAATGAPLTGDTAAWADRMEKGADVLLENVVSDFGGMPPFGLCMDCDADEFDALIAFMAKGK